MKIQTTFRFPSYQSQHVVNIAFESTTGSWVSFKIDGHTGIISDVVGFTPQTLIPNWFGETPFTNWEFSFTEETIVHLSGNTVQTISSEQNDLQRYVDLFSAKTICALWLGKFGYIVLDK